MKRILAINYSQSGQLHEIMGQFLLPFEAATVDRVVIKPATPFPFPWTTASFFNAMPETVLEEPIALEPLVFQQERYDLIVIGYQPWFLSPSLPTTGLFADPAFVRLLKDTPVITVIAGRNMWLNSQESLRKWIREAGGKLVGNVALIDKNANLASAVSILHWMLTGKKERKWGIFPVPGVSDEDIRGAAVFGQLSKEALDSGGWENLQKSLIAAGGININTNIMFIEGRAKTLFRIWAKLIKRKEATGGNRMFWVNFFKYYLLVALFIVAPIVLLLYNVLVRPFTLSSIKRKKQYFCSLQ